jgi:hypothetical protein
VVFLLGPNFMPFSYSAVAETGIALVPISEIDLVAAIDGKLDRLHQLTPRQELLLSGNRQLCLNTADSFWKSGDLLAARKWAEIAAAGPRPFIFAAKKLVEILIDSGDLVKARSIAQDAVLDKAHTALFIPLLLKIAKMEDNQPEIDYWTSRRQTISSAELGPLGTKREGPGDR